MPTSQPFESIQITTVGKHYTATTAVPADWLRCLPKYNDLGVKLQWSGDLPMVEATGDSQVKAIEALYFRLGELLFEVALVLRVVRESALKEQVEAIDDVLCVSGALVHHQWVPDGSKPGGGSWKRVLPAFFGLDAPKQRDPKSVGPWIRFCHDPTSILADESGEEGDARVIATASSVEIDIAAKTHPRRLAPGRWIRHPKD